MRLYVGTYVQLCIATAVLAVRIFVHEAIETRIWRKAARSVIYSAVVGDEIRNLDHRTGDP